MSESEPERVTSVWVTEAAFREFRHLFDPLASIGSIAATLRGTYPTAYPAYQVPGACFVLLGRACYILSPNLKRDGKRKGYGKYKLAGVTRAPAHPPA